MCLAFERMNLSKVLHFFMCLILKETAEQFLIKLFVVSLLWSVVYLPAFLCVCVDR